MVVHLSYKRKKVWPMSRNIDKWKIWILKKSASEILCCKKKKLPGTLTKIIACRHLLNLMDQAYSSELCSQQADFIWTTDMMLCIENSGKIKVKAQCTAGWLIVFHGLEAQKCQLGAWWALGAWELGSWFPGIVGLGPDLFLTRPDMKCSWLYLTWGHVMLGDF